MSFNTWSATGFELHLKIFILLILRPNQNSIDNSHIYRNNCWDITSLTFQIAVPSSINFGKKLVESLTSCEFLEFIYLFFH